MATTVVADVVLAPLFSDRMVVQREKPLSVWGTAAPEENISVSLKGDTVRTTAGSDGRWAVTIGPLRASATPTELVVNGENTVRVRDILVGDLWLCSGQSNMAFQVSRALNSEYEISLGNFPLIRHLLVPRQVAEQPADTFAAQWEVCSPETVEGFSAVAYYFARELHRRSGVPIGLINSTWGGTQVESWMNESAVKADKSASMINRRWKKRLTDYPAKLAKYKEQLAVWEKESAEAWQNVSEFTRTKPRRPEGPGSRWQPAGLYNAMISPLVPASLRGVIWYQGEQNAPHASEYASLFRGLITDWRTQFGEELPFYFVQLANFNRQTDKTSLTWAFLREAQQEALALPNTGMAITIDIGEVDDVHPRNKQEVGRRLALLVRAHLEGEQVEYSGPIFKGVKVEGTVLRIKFEHAVGLTSYGRDIIDIEVAGKDRKFVPAAARIEGDTIVVSSPDVLAPIAVRYAWHNYPDARLFNAAGLPGAPFRSVRW